MACEITFKGELVQMSNMMFARQIDFAIEVAERTASPEEIPIVQRLKSMQAEFWLGRGLEIEMDFPDIAERKLWCRVFYDTARAIFDRQVGFHDHSFWQVQTIHVAMLVAELLKLAVRDSEPDWSPDTIDGREFDIVVNKRK